MFVTSSRYTNDIASLTDENTNLLVTLDALKNNLAYAIYDGSGNCTYASDSLMATLG